jgi:hypothetical protein
MDAIRVDVEALRFRLVLGSTRLVIHEYLPVSDRHALLLHISKETLISCSCQLLLIPSWLLGTGLMVLRGPSSATCTSKCKRIKWNAIMLCVFTLSRT